MHLLGIYTAKVVTNRVLVGTEVFVFADIHQLHGADSYNYYKGRYLLHTLDLIEATLEAVKHSGGSRLILGHLSCFG